MALEDTEETVHWENIPQWHIDAVEDIYGKRDSWLIAYWEV